MSNASAWASAAAKSPPANAADAARASGESAELANIRRYLGDALKQPGIHLLAYGPSEELGFLQTLDDEMKRAVELSSAHPEWKEYLFYRLGAAQLSAIRKHFESGDPGAAFSSLEQLVAMYSH